jgi:hypothetical protein
MGTAQPIRELSSSELETVGGGFLPLLVGAALLLSGCAHCNKYVKKDPPPGGN